MAELTPVPGPRSPLAGWRGWAVGAVVVGILVAIVKPWGPLAADAPVLRSPAASFDPIAEASGALAQLYGRCAHAEALGSEEAALLGGGSDANTVAERGVPAIDGLGPRGKGFHTTDELIERATLVPKARALVRALGALATV